MEFTQGLICFILIFIFFRWNSYKFYKIKHFIYLAIFIRFCFALYHLYFGPWPFIGVLPDSGNDESWYLDYASNLASNPISSINVINFFSHELYPILLGLFFKIFGTSTLVGAAFNSIFGILILVNVFKISKIIWNSNNAKKATLIYCLIPMQAAYSVILLRESMLVFFLTSSIYLFLSWYFYSKSYKKLLYSFLFLIIASFLHDALLVLFIPMLYYLINKNSSNKFYKYIMISTVISLLFSGVLFNYTLDKINKEGFSTDQLELVRSSMEEKDRKFSTQTNSFNPLRYLYNFNLRPFIWEYQAGSLRVFNTIVFYYLLFKFITRYTIFRKNKKSKMLFVLSLFLILTFSFGSGDLYQSDRHRSKIIPLLLCMLPLSRIHE